MLKFNESGRSMVEILGVLAIIGVLSIGGVAGYTHAMNKSKANDILAGVSQRAVVASQQMILSGTPSFVEYAGQKIGDYGVALKTEGYPTDQFGIEVSGIEQRVCERLQDQGISNAVKAELGGIGFAEATCAEGEANALIYVFNDVLDPNKVSSGGGNNDKDVGVCANGNVYLWYLEDPCSVETPMESKACNSNEDCPFNFGHNYSCCDLDTNTCMSGMTDLEGNAICPEKNTICKKNSDCENDEFCNVNSYETLGYNDGDPMPDVGTCAPIGEGNTYGDFIITPYQLSWWAGNNWCAAVNANMATFEDLGCWFDSSLSSFYQCNWSELFSWLPKERYYVGNVRNGYKRWWLAQGITDWMGDNNDIALAICKKR